jgi:hypothetical protein
MNERIKELAEQVGANFGRGLEFAVVFGELEDLEKFAKLIVMECIETMRLVPYESDREFGDEIIYQEEVKKHFGVE